MKFYTKLYFNYFDYNPFEPILCERCTAKAVDLHHIQGRGIGKDVIENIIALCRDCHNLAHQKNMKDELQKIHNKNLKQ